MSKRIYLCSRVAKDARELNDRVAKSLRTLGYEVYVPHEEDANNPPPGGQFDSKAIYEADFKAMNQADICVAVSRLGRDCAWELGFFAARNKPIYYITCGNDDYLSSPMIIPWLQNQVSNPEEAGEFVKHQQSLINTEPL